MVTITDPTMDCKSKTTVIRKSYRQDSTGTTYQKITFQIVDILMKNPLLETIHITFTGKEWDKNANISRRVEKQLIEIKRRWGVEITLNGDILI